MKYHKKLNYHRQGVIVFSLAKYMFAFQPTLNGLELKKRKEKRTKYAIGWKSKGIYISYIFGTIRIYIYL